MADTPDLTGARRFVETADPPIAGGTWWVLADRTVAYQRPSGEWVHPAQVTVGALEAGMSWRAEATG